MAQPILAFEVEDVGASGSAGVHPGSAGCAVEERSSVRSSVRGLAKFVLTPFETQAQVRKAFTGFRVVFGLALLLLIVWCSVALEDGFFRTWERGPPGTHTLEECSQACEDEGVRYKFGDRKICVGPQPIRVQVGRKFVMGNSTEAGECQFRVNQSIPRGMATLALFAYSIALVMQGLRPEVVLLGSAALLAMFGVITSKTVFKGMTGSGVLGLAVIFPLSEALSETGILEKAMGFILGTPRTLNQALPRVILPVAALSAVLSNTATVALMIPVLTSWSRRLGVSPSKFMMPLSYAAQLGGVLTLVGSAVCLVAKDATMPIYRGGQGLQMFSMTPVGSILALCMTAVLSFLASTPLLSDSAAGPRRGSIDDTEGDAELELYRLRVFVHPPLAAQSLQDAGIMRIYGVHRVSCVGGTPDMLKDGDELELHCSVEGVVAVRSTPGLCLANWQTLRALGAQRRRRFLYEVSLDPDSEFLSGNIFDRPDTLLKELGAVLVAGPKAKASVESPPLCPGAVLLLEAHKGWVEDWASSRWSKNFSLVKLIPGSSPLRVGGPIDDVRAVAVYFGMILVVGITAFPSLNVELSVIGLVVLCFFLAIRAISVERMYAAIKADVLLIIVSASAWGDALQATGAVDTLAGFVVSTVTGNMTIMVAVYVLAAGLGAFISNSAVVAILGPMLEAIVQSGSSANPEALTQILLLAAGTCFVTPMGTTVNLMVVPAGNYTFFDFVRFGSVVQIAHMVLSIVLVSVMAPIFN